MILKNNLYRIKSVCKESKSFEIELLKDCFIYKAHFPEQPITPGVCIIQIAGELLEELTGYHARLSSISNAKFLAVIDPDKTPSVTYNFKKLEESETAIKVSITVTDKDVTFSKLSLVYNR